MNRQQKTWRLLGGVLGLCLVAAACSGADAPVEQAGGGDSPATETQASSTAASNGSSESSSSDDPHCWSGRCPRPISPTTWVDYHSLSPSSIVSLGDTRVMTRHHSHFQLWDFEDPTWGRSVDIDDGEFEVDLNAVWSLGGTRFATAIDQGIAVFDVDSADPTVPIARVGRQGQLARQLESLGGTQVVMLTAEGETEIWEFDGTAPVQTLDDSVRNLTVSPTGDIYFVNQMRELWQWQALGETRMLSPDILLLDGPRYIEIAPSGRVLMAEHELISVWVPETEEIVSLTGVDPGDDPFRFLAVGIGELPDGRIVGVYPDGRLVYWDINQPDSPVIISYDVNTTRTGLWAMEILPDGRLLISTAKGQEEGNDLVTIELVTPPPAG